MIRRDLFDELSRDGISAVERLVVERHQETVDVEFKTKARPANGEPDRTDRENFAQTLCAFANSIGGVLVWGVEARKNADDVDCASALQPIQEIEKFKSAVERLVSQAIMPRHEGVRIVAVDGGAGDGSGYLAVSVERSERRPHRAEMGDKAYFKRVGDSSIRMEHYDIEDAFKRASAAELRVKLVLSENGHTMIPSGRLIGTKIDFVLENASSLSARYPYFAVTSSQQVKYSSGSHFRGQAEHVIHPDNELIITSALIGTFKEPANGWVDLNDIDIPPIEFVCKYGCLNARQRTQTFRVFGRREFEEVRS